MTLARQPTSMDTRVRLTQKKAAPRKNAVFDWKRLGFGQMWQVKIVPERHGIEQDFEQDYALVITLETDHHGVQMYDRIAAEMRDQVEGIVEEQATESLA